MATAHDERPPTRSKASPTGRAASKVQRRREAWERLSWREAYRFLAGLLLRHPVALATAFGLGLLIAASEFLSIGLIMPFLASISPEGGGLIRDTKLGFLMPFFDGYSTVAKIRLIAIAFVALQVLKGTLSYLSGRVAHYIQIAVERDLKTMTFEQALAVDLQFHQQDQVANIYTHVRSYPRDTAKIGTEFLKSVPKAASLIAYVFVLLALSWQLTVLAAVLVLVVTVAINGLVRLVRKMSWEINESRVRQNHVTLESLHGLKVIRLFAREDHARERFRTTLEDLQSRQYKRGSLNSFIGPLHGVLNMAMFATIIIAATFVLDRSADAWVLLLSAFIVVMVRVMAPATSLVKRRTRMASALPSVQMVMEFLDRTDKPFMNDGRRAFERLREEVRFEGVTFRYGKDRPPALRDVSFAVPRGSTVALVGGSGAGKTTMINLLARLYDPGEGRITVDGTDLRDLKVASWRRRLAVVSQDTFLFNDSVRENIRYGRLDASDAEVEDAARQANAHDFILGLEDGYDTVVGDRGVRLSGGQAQRIAIARAILADPDVLILDEATSALDTATEREVQAAIDRVSRARTVVAIAHRLSTIRNADRILVLEEGRIVERGTHDELLARRGHYWRYVHLQDLIGDQEGADPKAALPAPGPVRLVLRAGAKAAWVRRNGTTLGELPILPVTSDAAFQAAMRRRNVAVLREGSGRATVRIDGETHEDVPLFVEKPSANGNGSAREVRVRVQALRPGRRADSSLPKSAARR